MNFSFSEHSVLVFYGNISAFQEAACLPLLSEKEMARAEKYLLPSDRNAYIVSKAILRQLVSLFLQVDEKTIEFEHSKNGKPFLSGNPALQFNSSHAGDTFAIGFTNNAAIGVDIENLSRNPNIQALENLLLTPSELEIFRQIPENKKQETFLSCWTKKEAILKATGDGLTRPMNEFEVLSTKENTRQLEVKNEPFPDQTGWFIESCTLMDHYLFSVAVKGHVNCSAYIPVSELGLLFR